MMAHRLVRRFGAIVLLFAWAQVATANAIPCAIWCEIAGSLDARELIHTGHTHDGAQPAEHHNCDASVSGQHCSTPQLLVATAVAAEPVVVPLTMTVAGDPPVPALHSFISVSSDFDTPPPRV